MEHIFCFELFHQTVGDKFVILCTLKVFGNCLEGDQETIEIVVAIQLFDLRQRTWFAVALPEFEQGCGIDRTLKMKVQLGLGQGNKKWTRPFHHPRL